MLVFSSFTPFSPSSFPDSFLTGLSAPNPVFGSAVPKKKRLQETGEKVVSEVGGGHRKALEKEPGRIFSSVTHNSLQNVRPLFSITISTYLVPWIFSIPAPRFWGSRSRKPFKQKCRDYKPSQVEKNQDLFCWEVRRNGRVFWQVPMKLTEILFNQTQEKMILLLLLNNQKLLSSLSISSCPLITPTSSFPTLLLKEPFKFGVSSSTIFNSFARQMVFLYFSTDSVEVWSWC